MKIGVSAFAWTANFKESHLELLPAVKGLGLDGVEIPMFDPSHLPIQGIRSAFEKHELECTVCAILPADLNPISPERAIREAAIEHLKRCVETASQAGAKLLGGPLLAPIGYLPGHRPTAEEWAWAVEAFRAIENVLSQTPDLLISIEPVNRSETFFLRTALEAARFCELLGNPRIGVTIDTFHANIEETSIAQAIHSLGPRLFHIHASENDRGPLGRGHVPFAEILAKLEEIQYRGYLMIEGFAFRANEKSAPGYLWADEDISPEIFLSESYDHLRALMATTSQLI